MAININVNGDWKAPTFHVKTEAGWQNGEKVYIKNDTGWIEVWSKSILPVYLGVWITRGASSYRTNNSAASGNATKGLTCGGSASVAITRSQTYNGFYWHTDSNLMKNGRAYHSSTVGSTYNYAIGGLDQQNSVMTNVEQYSSGTWLSLSYNLPSAVYYHTSCGNDSNKATLVYGGNSSSITSATFYRSASSWTTVNSLSQKRTNHSGCGDGTTALAINGYDYNSDYIDLQSMELYDGSVWQSSVTPLTKRVYGQSTGTSSLSITYGGRLYRLSPIMEPTAEIYNGTSWLTTASMTTGRASFAGFGEGINAVATGGSSTIYTDTEEYSSLNQDYYSPILVFSTGSNIIVNRYDFATCTTMIAGGYTNIGVGLISTETFSGAWTASVNLPVGRYSLRGCGASTAGLIVGGYDNDMDVISTSLEFDGTSWANTATTINNRTLSAVAGIQTSAYAAGGMESSSTFESYNGTAWTSRPTLLANMDHIAGVPKANTYYPAMICGGSSGNNNLTFVYSSEGIWVTANNMVFSTTNHSVAGSSRLAYLFPGSVVGSCYAQAFNGNVWYLESNCSPPRINGGSYFNGGYGKIIGGGYLYTTDISYA